MAVPLYANRNVDEGCKPIGLPLALIYHGKSFWKTHGGMMLPRAIGLEHRFQWPLEPMFAGIFMVAKASVVALMLMSVMVIYSRSICVPVVVLGGE